MKHIASRAAPLLLAATLAGCSLERAANPAQAAASAPAHHRAGGFQNTHVEFQPQGLGALLKWKWQALLDGAPPPPAAPTPQQPPDTAFIAANGAAGAAMVPTLTWIGHASMLLQLGGLNLLTDPVFSERVSPVSFVGPKRAVAPGLSLAQLPHVDLVVISHNHYDHLDAPSVRALAAQAGGPPLFLVPLGLKAWLAGQGITNAVELDWWQAHTVPAPRGPVELTLTPVQHWSGRGLFDRLETLWGGWAVLAPDQHVFFAGDTAYSPDFAEIRRRFAPRQQTAGGFDLALIPIGAYEPRWFMRQQHIDPAEAVRVHADLGAKQSVAMHWGTFALADEALDEPPRALARARAAAGLDAARFATMAIGETRRLQPRP